MSVDVKGSGKMFSDMDEMIMAYQSGEVGIHAKVSVRMYKDDEDKRGKLVESTVGRFIFNQKIPQDLGFVPDRNKDPYSLEVDFLCDKKKLGLIIDKCYRRYGNTKTAIMLDAIKDMGFHYSTKGAITISIADMEIPENKGEILENAQKSVDQLEDFYKRGLLSNRERYERVCEVWAKTTDDVADSLMESLGSLNNLYIMANSGARGSKKQISQVGGMRGLMANATGKTIEIPIKANFREGLSVLEYFISSNGARKGLADTALRTADSGYLTRRLVDVSHNVIVREEDCGSTEGIEIRAFTDGKELIEPLKQRIVGRTSLEDIVDPNTGELIVAANDEITESMADAIDEAGIEAVKIRFVMTCQSKVGVCAKCYGRNLATGESVNIGESVGITAAQSIGEPGTQLTMRTFHSGGVAGADITHGLPRVEELFEARNPKGLAEICENDGEMVYTVPYGARLNVSEGDYLNAGDGITKGPLNPHDMLRLKGTEGVYDYLLKEVQRVYKLQGVDINDKHVEVIISQMLSKFKIEDAGDTDLILGGLYNKFEIMEASERAEAIGGQPAKGVRQLLGITKASLTTNSFLSAASFQETTKVLTDAAIKGKTDTLSGLKENVIIGKLIPAGTGLDIYKNIEVEYGEKAKETHDWIENMTIVDEEKEDVSKIDFDSVVVVSDEGIEYKE